MNNIKYVTTMTIDGCMYTAVEYTSNRRYLYTETRLPKTVKEYIQAAPFQRESTHPRYGFTEKTYSFDQE